MNKFTSKVAAAALSLTLASVSGQALAADSTKPIVYQFTTGQAKWLCPT